jgi:hypothetical protein
VVILRECVVSRAVHFMRLLPPVGPWLETPRTFDRAVWDFVQRLLAVDGRLPVPPDTLTPARHREAVACAVQQPIAGFPFAVGASTLPARRRWLP